MGGDLDTYYQSMTKVNRVNNLDLDSEQGKLSAIYTYYKNFVGWDDNKINKYLGKLDANDLEEEVSTGITCTSTCSKRTCTNDAETKHSKSKEIKQS